jgi:hypothetical protein
VLPSEGIRPLTARFPPPDIADLWIATGSKVGMEQEGRFPPPRLSARCRISQETFAGTRANGRDAPEAVMGWQPAGVDVAPGPGHGGHSMNRITASAWR